MTMAKIAEHLNAQGYLLRSGKPWNSMQVKRVLELTDSPTL